MALFLAVSACLMAFAGAKSLEKRLVPVAVTV